MVDDGKYKREKKETTVPVFSVLKKGSILKNIFLNSPLPEPESSMKDDGVSGQEDDDPILIGRHPDCHIVLDHPSISRFHLLVHVKPAAQKLSVIDQDSVHGTWVSGTKIEARVPVELVDGDTLRLGASTRVYELHWVLPSRVSDVGNPLEALLEEKEDSHQEGSVGDVIGKSNEKWADEIASAPPMLESTSTSFTDNSTSKGPEGKDNSSMLVVGEDKTMDEFSAADEVLSEKENSSPSRSVNRVVESSLLSRRNKSVGVLSIPTGRSNGRMGRMETEIHQLNIVDFKYGETETPCHVLPDNVGVNHNMKNGIFSSENESSTMGVSYDPKLNCYYYHELEKWTSDAIADAAEEGFAFDMEKVAFQIIYHQMLQESGAPQSSSGSEIGGLKVEDVGFLDEAIETPAVTGVLNRKPTVSENCENLEEVEVEEEEAFVSDKENMTPIVSHGHKSHKSCSRISRLPSEAFAALNAEFGLSTDKENSTPPLARELKQKQFILENSENIRGLEEEEEQEVFASDKENMTPIVSHGQKSRKGHLEILRLPLEAFAALNAEDGFYSDKENTTPVFTEEMKPKLSISETSENMGELIEEEKGEVFISAQANITPNVSHGHKSHKSCMEIPRLYSEDLAALNADNCFHSDKENTCVVTGEMKQKLSMSETNENITDSLEEKGEVFVSARKNISPIVSHGQKSQKSLLQISILHSEAFEDGFFSDKENNIPSVTGGVKRMQAILQSCLKIDGKEEVASVSNKENMTPVASHGQRSHVSHTGIQRPSLNAIAALSLEEDMFQSDREQLIPELFTDSKPKNPASANSLRSSLEEAFDKEYPNLNSHTDLRNSSSNGILGLTAELDVFCSDKENRRTPKVSSRHPKSTKGTGRKLVRHEGGETTSSSNKENLTPDASALRLSPLSKSHAEIEKQIMKKRVERIPFQSLLENSPIKASNSISNGRRAVSKCKNSPSSCVDKAQSNGILNQPVDKVLYKVVGEKKKWNIVVDTSCFLDEESRRSLQLLEGLRGTHLIIPRMVIRELDCLKRRERWYRKAPKASSALQWVEECMGRASWWIHVQSSSENLPVPPTPPASPRLLDAGSTELAEATRSSMAFSTCGTLMEVLSPTAEDHILDCALLFKRTKTDGHLILLTNNIALKIKAMAEGLLCETPAEFRESLVNPLSKRFMWAESSPRGSTWSFSSERDLMPNYWRQLPNMRKMTKVADSAKGLKLILLHNVHYGQASLTN